MERKNELKYQSDLIVKYLTNNLTDEERIEFDLWLNASPANNELVESFRDTTARQKELNYLNAIDIDQAWKNLNQELNPRTMPLFSVRNIMKYGAAVLIISFALGSYWYIHQNPSEILQKKLIAANIVAGTKRADFVLANGKVINLNDSEIALQNAAIHTADGTLFFAKTEETKGNNELRTPKAGEYKMVLPDGTHVWLNALSSLRFANSFNKTERKVVLKGEAYFEVAHNRAMPFVVSFNDSEVEVLGTHFNINTYDKESRTTLLEGSVKITEGNSQKLLKPGEEATISTRGIAVSKVDTYQSVAWKEGLFLFEEENMVDILDQVARWYDVEIAYDGKPNHKKYSGNIRRQANLNQVLEMLTAVSGNKFTLADRTITVKF